MASGTVLAGFGLASRRRARDRRRDLRLERDERDVGVVAADFFQVAVIVVGIPLAAWRPSSHVTGRGIAVLATPFIPQAWARAPSS